MVHRSDAERPYEDYFPRIVARFAHLAVAEVVGGQQALPGRIYIPPRGQYVLFERGAFQLRRLLVPPARPDAIDVLFRSAAVAYGDRITAVVLSGMLRDGTAGLWDVRRRGGVTIVQEPSEARYASMPRSALEEVPLHYCLPLAAIGPKLVELSRQERAAARRARVLIVEDERIVAASLEQRLADLGYHIVGSMNSGEDAVRVAGLVAPDVVLMDVQLAGPMTGTEAGRIIWESLAVPIVFLTAYSDEKTVDEAKQAMSYGFVVKPYRPAQLHATLQLALDRREREMQIPTPEA